jgi:hypothetical protein
VGEIFDFQADSNLRVQDTVSIAIEYGETQLMGNPAIDPSILQLVRIANGQAIFPHSFNDLSAHVISGSYHITPGELDQFGEFAVVCSQFLSPEPCCCSGSDWGLSG